MSSRPVTTTDYSSNRDDANTHTTITTFPLDYHQCQLDDQQRQSATDALLPTCCGKRLTGMK